ncbi:fluoride efflux transporter CrcB [Candidatus Fermentibacteria bacterium]|nr:MAG: fluoride efflux transporter CrcB [Candidatus Fermentibacteria bacterium]
MLSEAAAVGVGGFAGAVVRHFVIGVTGSTTGIISVNLAGCLLLGFLTGDSKLTLFLATGFLGALTTFSAFSGHTVKLWNAGETTTAALFILVNVFAGIAAFVTGMGLKGKFFS